MSHEHEGPGGVLEMHEAELDRIAGDDRGKRAKMTFAAWAKPKAERRRLINSILQLGVNAVFCFRAKEKLKIQTGRDPIPLGWMPIAGEEFVYEMALHCLLYPGCGGVPTWDPQLPGERAMTKLPEQFRAIFSEETPLSEEIGQRLAQWAAGDGKVPTDDELESLLADIAAAEDVTGLTAVTAANRGKPWTPKQRAEVNAAVTAKKAELEA
jgi:hypothetical protein